MKLDLGGGIKPLNGYVGMDTRYGSIYHDLEIVPYPIKGEQCEELRAFHIWEHLNPKLTIDIINEWWRILMPNGILNIVTPYGVNRKFIQDPTHINPSNESTWEYFDKRYPLWTVYRPSPWKIINLNYKKRGNMSVVLKKEN